MHTFAIIVITMMLSTAVIWPSLLRRALRDYHAQWWTEVQSFHRSRMTIVRRNS